MVKSKYWPFIFSPALVWEWETEKYWVKSEIRRGVKWQQDREEVVLFVFFYYKKKKKNIHKSPFRWIFTCIDIHTVGVGREVFFFFLLSLKKKKNESAISGQKDEGRKRVKKIVVPHSLLPPPSPCPQLSSLSAPKKKKKKGWSHLKDYALLLASFSVVLLAIILSTCFHLTRTDFPH